LLREREEGKEEYAPMQGAPSFFDGKRGDSRRPPGKLLASMKKRKRGEDADYGIRKRMGPF